MSIRRGIWIDGRYRHIGMPLRDDWRFGFVWIGRLDYFFIGFYQVLA